MSITRESMGSTLLVKGQVDLRLASPVERFIEIPGLVSCSGPEDCPDPSQPCLEDLRCG